jgi:hypothetical protein
MYGRRGENAIDCVRLSARVVGRFAHAMQQAKGCTGAESMPGRAQPIAPIG